VGKQPYKKWLHCTISVMDCIKFDACTQYKLKLKELTREAGMPS